MNRTETTTIPLTHKGWFLLCPVYVGDLEAEGAPAIAERHWAFSPLLGISFVLYLASFAFMDASDPNARPMWPLRVTGTIPPGRSVPTEPDWSV